MLPDNLDSTSIVEFQARVMSWGADNYQEFPWRNGQTAYEILIAETLLHRTRARQAEPVYRKFLQRYPDLDTLSQAAEEDIRNLLWPLGLHWRVEKLLDLVREIVEVHQGEIPRDRSCLMSLPGVSGYIASAIRCFFWGEQDALLDTNTVRIAGRVFGLKTTDSSRRGKRFMSLLTSLVPERDPGAYNYALLDLAHLKCAPKSPDCVNCPLRDYPCEFGVLSSNDQYISKII